MGENENIAPLSATPTGSEASALVKRDPRGGYSPVGNIPLGKEETASLLARMQEMVDQRSSPLSLLLSGLKDASAAGSGGFRGPTEAINLRDRQKMAEAQELFRMRSDMAALRSAQEMAEKQDVGLDELMGVAKPETASAAQQPQGGQVIGPSGQPVPDLILKQMAQKRRMKDRAGAQAIYDDWAKTQIHKDIETAGRAESYSQEAKLYDKKTGQLTTVPAIEAMRNPDRYSYVPITGGVPTTTDTGTKVTGAPTVGQSKYLNTSAAQMANKLGTTSGEFTDDELNRLASTESGKDPFALNKDTKAMGRYQFMPETVQSLHQRGIAFNPFDEKQSREIARSELNRLTKELGSKELALAAYGGFRDKDPTKYIGGILTKAPAQTVSATAVTSGPPPSTGNRAQDLQNLKNWEESQKREVEIASKGPEKASTAAGERRAKMFELADQTDQTVKSADTVIAANTNFPESTGIGKGRTGANFLVTTAGAIVPKMDKAKAEDIYASFQDEPTIKAREAIVGASKQLGIDFAANVFKGARMGIGLENMAANAKNVSEYNTAETNIINAKLIKEAALFNKARAELYNQWAPKNGGAMANFEKFETSPEYKALAKATQEKIASELPEYLKIGKDGLEEVNPSKKSNSQNDARAELERRKKAKGNQ
jgi:hypothetical protein